MIHASKEGTLCLEINDSQVASVVESLNPLAIGQIFFGCVLIEGKVWSCHIKSGKGVMNLFLVILHREGC